MNTVRYLTLALLVPLCAQAMESENLYVYFKDTTTDEETRVSVDEGESLRVAVRQYRRKERIEGKPFEIYDANGRVINTQSWDDILIKKDTDYPGKDETNPIAITVQP